MKGDLPFDDAAGERCETGNDHATGGPRGPVGKRCAAAGERAQCGASRAKAEVSGENVVEYLASDDYHAGRRFDGVNFSGCDLSGQTFEDCTFASCHFVEMSLARVAFLSCAFDSCEFTLARLENTTFNTAHFRACKLLGLNFTDCNKFGFLPDFDGCLLDSVVFCANSLKRGRFVSCTIRDSDFMESDLREAVFDGSTLEATTFQKCNLEKADFRRASSYSIDPLNNRLARARFSLPEAQSFLGFLGIIVE